MDDRDDGDRADGNGHRNRSAGNPECQGQREEKDQGADEDVQAQDRDDPRSPDGGEERRAEIHEGTAQSVEGEDDKRHRGPDPDGAEEDADDFGGHRGHRERHGGDEHDRIPEAFEIAPS